MQYGNGRVRKRADAQGGAGRGVVVEARGGGRQRVATGGCDVDWASGAAAWDGVSGAWADDLFEDGPEEARIASLEQLTRPLRPPAALQSRGACGGPAQANARDTPGDVRCMHPPPRFAVGRPLSGTQPCSARRGSHHHFSHNSSRGARRHHDRGGASAKAREPRRALMHARRPWPQDRMWLRRNGWMVYMTSWRERRKTSPRKGSRRRSK